MFLVIVNGVIFNFDIHIFIASITTQTINDLQVCCLVFKCFKIVLFFFLVLTFSFTSCADKCFIFHINSFKFVEIDFTSEHVIYVGISFMGI